MCFQKTKFHKYIADINLIFLVLPLFLCKNQTSNQLFSFFHFPSIYLFILLVGVGFLGSLTYEVLPNIPVMDLETKYFAKVLPKVTNRYFQSLEVKLMVNRYIVYLCFTFIQLNQ